jgi:hypothetical protein
MRIDDGSKRLVNLVLLFSVKLRSFNDKIDLRAFSNSRKSASNPGMEAEAEADGKHELNNRNSVVAVSRHVSNRSSKVAAPLNTAVVHQLQLHRRAVEKEKAKVRVNLS